MAKIPIGKAPPNFADLIDWFNEFIYYLENPNLEDNSITTPKFVDGAVTTNDIANTSITGVKLSVNAISSNNLTNSAVTNAKLDNATNITGDKFASGSVTQSKISGVVAYTNNFADNSVALGDLATDSVDASKITAGGVDTSEIADNSIAGDKLGNDINGDKIKDNSILNAKLQDLSIVGGNIQNGAIDGFDIADLALSTAKFKNSSITNSKFENYTLWNHLKFADNTITGDRIASNTIGGLNVKIPAGLTKPNPKSRPFLVNKNLIFRAPYYKAESSQSSSNDTVNAGTLTIAFLEMFPESIDYANVIDINHTSNTIQSEVHFSGALCVSGDTDNDNFAVSLQFLFYDRNAKLTREVELQKHEFTIIQNNELLMIPVNAHFSQEVLTQVLGFSPNIGYVDGLRNLLTLHIYRTSGVGTLTLYQVGNRSSYLFVEV